MKKLFSTAFILASALSINAVQALAETESVADVTPFLKEYDCSYTMEVLNQMTFTDWVECSFDSKTAGYGSFSISAGEEPGTIIIPGFIEGKEAYRNVGVVDMDAKTITFAPQQVYEEAGYSYCLIKLPENLPDNLSTTMGVVFENAEAVVATFDDEYNITFNDWTYGVNYGAVYPGMGVYPEYRATKACFTPKKAEVAVADVTPFLKEYDCSYTMEVLNQMTFTDWVECSFDSKTAGYGSFSISAGEEPGTIIIPGFIEGKEAYRNVGVVDMDAKTITFAPQQVYEEAGYPYCLIKLPENLPDNLSTTMGVVFENAEAVVATFDDEYNITFNDWTYGVNYGAVYPGMGVYPEYRATKACFTPKKAEVAVADVTPFLKEYDCSYTMEVLNQMTFTDWVECSFDSKTAGYGSFSISAGEEPGTIIIPGFIEGKEAYRNVGVVDMDAKTITFAPQQVYEEEGYPYCLIKLPENLPDNLSTTMGVVFENAEAVVATFDDEYNITFNDWTYGVNYGAVYPGMGVYPEYRATKACFTPKKAEVAVADVTPFLGNYEKQISMEVLNEETYTDWNEFSFNSLEAGFGSFEIKAGEEAGTIVIPDFINEWEGFTNVGTVDMENRTITFAPQVVYEENGYPYYLVKAPANIPDNLSTSAGIDVQTAEAIVATFDDEYNITFNDWTYGWDYGSLYPGMGMYPFYRNTKAYFFKKSNESRIESLVNNDGYSVRYFDLQGREVPNGESLTTGIYIRIKDGKSEKILVK